MRAGRREVCGRTGKDASHIGGGGVRGAGRLEGGLRPDMKGGIALHYMMYAVCCQAQLDRLVFGVDGCCWYGVCKDA